MTPEDFHAEDAHKLALLWANLIREAELNRDRERLAGWTWDHDLGAWTSS